MSINTFVYQGIFSFYVVSDTFVTQTRIFISSLTVCAAYLLGFRLFQCGGKQRPCYAGAEGRGFPGTGLILCCRAGEITSGLLFVLAGHQGRRTLIHIPDSSSSPPFIFLIAVVSSTCHRSRLWTTCVFTSDETEIMFHKLEFKSQLSDLMCRIFPAAVICVVFSELLN